MLIQERLNKLVLLAQENNDTEAINELWEFYFPLLKKIILFEVTKFEVEEDSEDIINDCYVIFCEGLLKADLRNYFFSKYIKEYMEIELSKLIISKYIMNIIPYYDFYQQEKDFGVYS